MRIPVLYRIFGMLKTYVDNYQYSDKLFKKLQSKEIFFVQIGANDGLAFDPIFKYNDKWNGVLIEPIPNVFEKLKENYKNKKGNYDFRKCAISSQNGILDLYVPIANDVKASFDKDIASNLGGEIEKIKVSMITLDSLIEEKYKNKEIDLLLIDTEGHELEILNSYSFKNKPKVIFIETRFYDYNDITPFYQYMHKHGYSIFPEKDNCLFILK